MMNHCFAVADMGTNSFHMIITRLNSDGTIKIIDKERQIIRLGSHTGKELSFISDEETDLAISVLRNFKKLSDSYNAVFKAVATSAVREARNRSEFIKKIKDSIGISVEVIGGKKEAWFIYLGARKALSLYNKNVLCIDIGGGSTEFINVNGDKTVFSESVKIGAVRLSKHFFPDYNITDDRMHKCSSYIEGLLKEHLESYSRKKFDMIVGTSGTIEALASLIIKKRKSKIPKSLNSVSFNKDELKLISGKILSAKTTAERKKIKGMEEKRADIIPAGLQILNEVFNFFRIDTITVSDYALREGVILDMMGKYESEGEDVSKACLVRFP
jgi:exopolyphosphatase/guanosine-5'-triphosphate,3'-diphosphate pyrophosphatase